MPSLSSCSSECSAQRKNSTSIASLQLDPPPIHHHGPGAPLAPQPPPAKRKQASPCATTTTVETERAAPPPHVQVYVKLSAQLPGGLPLRASKARIVETRSPTSGWATVAELEVRAAFATTAQTATPISAGADAGAAEVLVAGGKASCFAVRLPEARCRGVLMRVLEVLRRHGMPVLAARVTRDSGEASVTVTTAPVPPRFLQGIQQVIRSSIA